MKRSIPRITSVMLKSFSPCYDASQISVLGHGKRWITAFDVLEMQIPAADKLWLILRPGVIGDKALADILKALKASKLITCTHVRKAENIAAPHAWNTTRLAIQLAIEDHIRDLFARYPQNSSDWLANMDAKVHRGLVINKIYVDIIRLVSAVLLERYLYGNASEIQIWLMRLRKRNRR